MPGTRHCVPKNDAAKNSEIYDRMVRMHLGDLKATKSAREGDTTNIKTTPAEWAAAIMKRVKEEETGDLGVQAGGDGAFPTGSKTSVAFDEGGDSKISDETKGFDG